MKSLELKAFMGGTGYTAGNATYGETLLKN